MHKLCTIIFIIVSDQPRSAADEASDDVLVDAENETGNNLGELGDDIYMQYGMYVSFVYVWLWLMHTAHDLYNNIV